MAAASSEADAAKVARIARPVKSRARLASRSKPPRLRTSSVATADDALLPVPFPSELLALLSATRVTLYAVRAPSAPASTIERWTDAVALPASVTMAATEGAKAVAGRSTPGAVAKVGGAPIGVELGNHVRAPWAEPSNRSRRPSPSRSPSAGLRAPSPEAVASAAPSAAHGESGVKAPSPLLA